MAVILPGGSHPIVDVNYEENEDTIAGEAGDARKARAILDSIGIGVLAADDKGVISYANEKAVEFFSPTSAPPLVGNNLFRLEGFHFSHLFRLKYDKVKSSGEPEIFDESYSHYKRMRYNLFPSGGGMTIVAEDITRDWIKDEAQRAALLILNNLGEAVFMVRKSGHVVYANEAACRATGYSWDEFIHLYIIISDVIPALDGDRLKSVGDSPDSHIAFEAEIRRKEGRAIPVAVSAIRKRLYNIDQYIVAAWDITGRKQAEKELVNAKAQAELYLDLMGHDISNMHQIALGYLELARGMSPGEEKAEFLDKPVEVLQRSARLISNVRKLQKLNEGVFQAREVDVGQVLVDVQQEYGAIPHKRVTLKVSGHCMIRANDLLHDVFANLVSNAIKHTGDRTSIAINLDVVRDDGGQYCRVIVEDDGPGIPDYFKDAIFNRKLKGTGKAKGMGLGLYLVKSLVDSYGGKVWAEDRVNGDYGKGARFVVLLPMVEE